MLMRLEAAKRAAATQLHALSGQKNKLTKLLKETPKENKNFDRVEISKQLQKIEKAYDLTQEQARDITVLEMGIAGAESAKQQGEAMAKRLQEYTENMLKCMEVYRRIADGGKVPSGDERRLMQYDPSLYIAAKNEAMMNRNKEEKQYDSLWDDEEAEEETQVSPSEVAANASISVDLPECPEITVDISAESLE